MLVENVTREVKIGRVVDEECVPVLRCACGAEFAEWDFIISVYPDDPRPCPAGCGRKLYFQMSISVTSVRD